MLAPAIFSPFLSLCILVFSLHIFFRSVKFVEDIYSLFLLYFLIHFFKFSIYWYLLCVSFYHRHVYSNISALYKFLWHFLQRQFLPLCIFINNSLLPYSYPFFYYFSCSSICSMHYLSNSHQHNEPITLPMLVNSGTFFPFIFILRNTPIFPGQHLPHCIYSILFPLRIFLNPKFGFPVRWSIIHYLGSFWTQ